MLDEFLILVEEVFEKRFFDMPASQIIGGALVVIAFLAVRRILRTQSLPVGLTIAHRRSPMANF